MLKDVRQLEVATVLQVVGREAENIDVIAEDIPHRDLVHTQEVEIGKEEETVETDQEIVREAGHREGDDEYERHTDKPKTSYQGSQDVHSQVQATRQVFNKP